ncbi:MAG: lipoprotein-releasing ABC transporter ATP-binding protein LolD [Arsenophonus sp.]|nr:MAG: lipoprotein-releasing ABC transporter ATP-binding protein LolD [Arsenophonus sp.]
MSNSDFLVCKNLFKEYKDGINNKIVLNNISFSIKKREMVVIIGSSGSGKSTLLHVLGGLDNFSSGSIFFNGKDFSSFSINEKSKFRNKELGFIYQFHHLLPDFTVLENVMMPLLIANISISKAKYEAFKLLDLLGLNHHANNKTFLLSGGERQRVSIARALINNPSLILADEPTGNLDFNNAKKIFNILVDMNKKKGTSFLIVTHDLKLAHSFSRKFEMRDGILLDCVF